MSIKGIQKTFQLPNGHEVILETGKLAKQADGSVVVKIGDNMLLATVVASKEANEGVDFLPLSVDYREMYSAAGRFPGGFFKREARPSDREILVSRLVDRAIRPLFPSDYHSQVQVLIYLISVEEDFAPESYAALAASAALSISDIPFSGPISEVNIAYLNGEFIANPNQEQLEEAELELMVAADKDNIMMVEGEADEVSEELLMEALKKAHDVIKIQCDAQNELAAMVEGSDKVREYTGEETDEELKEKVAKETSEKVKAIAAEGIADKHLRKEKLEAIREEFKEQFDEETLEEKESLINKYFHDVEKEEIRKVVLENRTRLDGRKLDEIRPIWTEINYLPKAHGSAIFTRGETQSLTSVTLGSKLDEQIIDGAVIEGKSKLLLHYNFPPFSTGEARMLRGVSRREVGHGNLALRALKGMIPGSEENPYTIRIVSDILESNGSSSMATVCAGTMALMDAGVKMKKPVSGIAMGLITDEDSDNYAVLSDILGDEDHLGDMDFKVTGTRDGITACQMDIKVEGLSYQVLAEALEQAKKGRLHILDKMEETISAPREDYKDFVPRIEKMVINKDKIGAVIGSGGKVIQELQEQTNTEITIEEVEEQGIIEILSPSGEALAEAKTRIEQIIAEPEVGETYTAKVKSLMPYGAFVEFMPGIEGLLHVSELDWKRIDKVEDLLKEGDTVDVKLLNIDERSGKFKLSRKALLPKPEGYVERERKDRGGRDKKRSFNKNKNHRNKRRD